jgi:hypothetical protein
MKNEFVPYELALRMKQLGFDIPTFGYYQSTRLKLQFPLLKSETQTQTYMREEDCSAPTFQQTFRWFREKYNIFPEILTDCTTEPKFCYTYNRFFGNSNDLSSEEWWWENRIGEYSLLYKTYEEAELVCLEKLIEVVEQSKTEYH